MGQIRGDQRSGWRMAARRWMAGALVLIAPAGAGAATLTLDWDAVTTNADGSAIADLAGYRIFQRSGSLLGMTTAQATADAGVTKIPVANVLTHDVTGLLDGASYYFRLTARDDAGNQSGFNWDGALDLEVTTFTAAPRAPINVSASALSHQQVRLTWRDDAGGEGGFRIERSSPDNASYALVLTTAASAGTGTLRAFTDPAVLTPQTTYYYRVRANGAAAHSPYVEVFAVTPAAPTAPPVQPASLRVTGVADDRVTLAWNDNAADETAFELRWSLTGVDGWSSAISLSPNTTSYAHAGLLAGTSYYYQLRAVNGVGNPSFGPASPVSGRTTGGVVAAGFRPPAGLREAYCYPNPVKGTDPVIRAFMGGVDEMEVTIFDAAGRLAHSGRTTTAVTVDGETALEYRWTGDKTPGVYYAVLHGKKGSETVRARAKFAVVR